MEAGKEWRCQRCKTLLGIERESRLYLRYKQAQYIVDGRDYVVMAVCRNCSAVNERTGTKDPPYPIAAGK